MELGFFIISLQIFFIAHTVKGHTIQNHMDYLYSKYLIIKLSSFKLFFIYLLIFQKSILVLILILANQYNSFSIILLLYMLYVVYLEFKLYRAFSVIINGSDLITNKLDFLASLMVTLFPQKNIDGNNEYARYFINS